MSRRDKDKRKLYIRKVRGTEDKIRGLEDETGQVKKSGPTDQNFRRQTRSCR
jgi:hypothetical protein